MFHKNMKDSIYMFLTFADCASPPILEALKEGKIEYVEHFKFNNSALFSSNQSKGTLTKMFWDYGQRCICEALRALDKMKTKSLLPTAEVLQDRHRMELMLLHLRQKIDIGLGKLKTLKIEMKILEAVEGD